MSIGSWLGRAALALAVLIPMAGLAVSVYLSTLQGPEAPTPEVFEGEGGYVLTGADFPTPIMDTGNQVGYRVPDFTLTLADGSAVTSASLVEVGQPTFLFFWATI